ncbi:MAG: SusC/RagA family TonB-linked outer membrane protein [Ginsengibacter sp.]
MILTVGRQNNSGPFSFQTKAWMVMKLTIASLLFFTFQVSANGNAQQITIVKKNASLTEVFKAIEQQTGCLFFYDKAAIRNADPIDIAVKNATLEEALSVCLKDRRLTYSIVRNTVVIRSERKASYFQSQAALTAMVAPEPPPVELRGRVVNREGVPLQGASVLVAGTKNGTTTNNDGRFTLTVSNGENIVLEISSVGYQTKRLNVGKQTEVNVTLELEVSGLSDVVVTALGIKREAKSLTYSTQSVNPKSLSEARELNVLTSLEGKVAGLSVTSSSGGLGTGVRVILRGNRSIDGDSQPLYVIDGVIGADPTTISPDNIASIDVLKGANASALYGSLAQNGVIIMETKKGVSGSHISLSQTFMEQDPYGLLPFQNVYGQGYGGVYSKSADASWGPKMTGQMVDTWSLDPADAGKQYAFLPQPNNRMDAFQKGYNSATNLTASMGSENLQAFFSYTYTDGKGIVANNDLKRHNISTRITSKLTSKLSLDSKIEFMQQEIDNRTDGYPNPIEQIYNMPANIRTQDLTHYSFQNTNGNTIQNYWNSSTVNGQNAYWVQNKIKTIAAQNNTIVMTSLTYSFSDALKLMVRASYDGYGNNGNVKNYSGTYPGGFGLYSESKGQGFSLNSDFLLSYKNDITKDLNVRVSAGGTTLKFRNSSIDAGTGAALLVPNLFSISNTNAPTASYSPGSSTNKNSLYAFTTVSFKNALFLDLTGRNDWSSTLPAASRSYFYPSVGLSAVLTDLIPTLPKAVTFLKLRMSYADVGNDTRPYLLQRAVILGPGGNNGFLQLDGLLPNNTLLPEKTSSSELGLEFRLFDDRVGLNITGYQTDTRNQLFQLSLPVGSGATSYFTNGGNVRNKGVEVVLSLTPVKTRNFNWDINMNFALNRNKVVKISDVSPKIISGDSYFKDFVIAQGQPYGQMYGKGWQRDPKGRVLIGSDGLPLITPGRSVLLSNFNPDWMGGMQNSFQYKNFNLSFLIDTRQGGTMVSQSNAIVDGLGLSQRTLAGRSGDFIFGKNVFGNETAVLADGTPNNIPITAEKFWTAVGGRNAPIAEPFVISATNTRLRELTLGYSFPKSLLNKAHFLADARISIVGRNLFFISRASPYVDPDLMLSTDKTTEGQQYFNPPSSRYYGFNLKIGFK